MGPTVVVGTWSFSDMPVSVVGKKLFQESYSCAEAVKQGINVAENDPAYGQHFVGRCGSRNSDGYLELDAAIMDGRHLDFGAVTAIQGVPAALAVASDVMNHSRHSMLTGSGAMSFARQRGYAIEEELLKPIRPSASQTQGAGKDTLGVLALHNGDICAGVTTSGTTNKSPGRVGDSPLPGSGLYADTEGGAACATGDGDDILKYCPSFHAVLLMKQGKTAQEACDMVMAEILGKRNPAFEMGMIALDMKGNAGASGTVISYTDPRNGTEYAGFPYTVFREGDTEPQVFMKKATRI